MKMNSFSNNSLRNCSRPTYPHVCVITFLLTCSLLCSAGGCSSSGSSDQANSGNSEGEHAHEHDHGHRPDSYIAALAQIKHARDEVKAAFDAGTPRECDDALHELAEVLDVLPEVAAETDLPKQDWEIVKEQAAHLFDQFMKIHIGFHGGEKQGVTYESVAEEINKAIERLESKVVATGEELEETDDADHHEQNDEHGADANSGTDHHDHDH